MALLHACTLEDYAFVGIIISREYTIRSILYITVRTAWRATGDTVSRKSRTMHYAFLLSAYLTTASFLREMDPGISTRPVAVPGGPIHIPKRTGAVAAFELSMVSR